MALFSRNVRKFDAHPLMQRHRTWGKLAAEPQDPRYQLGRRDPEDPGQTRCGEEGSRFRRGGFFASVLVESGGRGGSRPRDGGPPALRLSGRATPPPSRKPPSPVSTSQCLIYGRFPYLYPGFGGFAPRLGGVTSLSAKGVPHRI